MKRTYRTSKKATPQCVLGPDGPVRGDRRLEGDTIVVEADHPAIGVRVLYDAGAVGKVSLDTLALGDEAPGQLDLEEELYRAREQQLKERCAAWGVEPPRHVGGLEELLAASEGAAAEAAKRDLAARRNSGDLDSFFFGCSLRWLEEPAAVLDLFAEAFSLVTLRFYWRAFEPHRGQHQWERMEKLVAWGEDHHITVKGHPLLYFHPSVVPDWADRDFAGMKEQACRHVVEVVDHFRGHVDIWDVINEAHGAANCLKYSYEQMIELTVATCAAARQTNPAATLLVNCTDLWGGLAASNAPATTMRYCRDILAAGADFDVLGLQLYVGPGLGGVRDLFEFSRTLDAYGALGKPIHLTEIGVPSSCEPDVLAGRKVTDILSSGWWHGPWSEQIQAEWVRAFFQVAASKPFVDALGWWDLSDDGKHFHTHGGLLRPDFSPKPAYVALREFRRG